MGKVGIVGSIHSSIHKVDVVTDVVMIDFHKDANTTRLSRLHVPSTYLTPSTPKSIPTLPYLPRYLPDLPAHYTHHTTPTKMLALQPSSSSSEQPALIPNLLPCKIAHSGPIPTSQRHWNPLPTRSPKHHPNSHEVHFRGRKLRSKQLKLPEKYTGVVAQKTERRLSPQQQGGQPQGRRNEIEEDQDQDEEDTQLPTEVKILETNGTFDQVVIWAHEAVPEGEDVYVKGIEEWIGFAESVGHLSVR